MGLRPALIALGAATLASFAAGALTGSRTRLGSVASAAETAPQPPAKVDDTTFKDKILPFTTTYCLPCHNDDKPKGGLSLTGQKTDADARKNRKDWGAIQHVLAAGEMPPKNAKQPTKSERETAISAIENTLTKVDCGLAKDPGRVTIRRLNRAEYNNTIRDLCGVDFKPAEDFPADDVGYGFDNIGDVLSFQPILFEKYMAAADKILSTALTLPEIAKTQKNTVRAQAIQVTVRGAKSRETPQSPPKITLQSEGSAFLEKLNFPGEGEYVVRFRGWGSKVGDEFPKVVFRIEGKDLKTVTVDASKEKPQTYEMRANFTPGEKRVSMVFSNPFEDKKETDAAKKFRQFGIDLIEVEGPFNPKAPPDPASVKLLLTARPSSAADKTSAARQVLSSFASRAYRRPAKAEEVARLVKLFEVADKQGEPFEKAVRLPMKAVLVSPHFLYRIEEDPKDPNGVRTISDHEFATRLSYFIWSSMPDAELRALADKGELRKPAVLEAQVKRMLADPKSRALGENFAGQWLQLRNLKTIAPDRGSFPAWDAALQTAMGREAEAFFEYVVKNDRSVMEFLDADYTFVNARLAKHYGIADVKGDDFQQVKLTDGRRGGIITMASTLTVTSNPTRTSPVKRGKWILENILGTPPPPPAPDVPELPPTGELKGTLRQQMEQHRSNPACATCHAKLDPLGFGLENFDAVGGWRTTDNKQPIDSSGVMPDGKSFKGPGELRKVLLGKSDLFRRCLAEKLLTFALGRGLEYYDKCAVDDIVKAAQSKQDKFSALVMGVVTSDPFQKRKGKRSE
jgi:hypothetical protein